MCFLRSIASQIKPYNGYYEMISIYIIYLKTMHDYTPDGKALFEDCN